MVFNRDNRSGGGYASRQGGRDFDRRSFGDDRGRDRQMFKATCSSCGKECEVPFKPTGSKPVYCRDCFRTMRNPDSKRFSGRSNFDNRNEDRDRNTEQPSYKDQFVTLHAKLDKILKLLNPEKSMEAPIVVAKPQFEDVTNSVKNVEPVKKKIRAKKLVPTEDTIKTSAVIETPTE